LTCLRRREQSSKGCRLLLSAQGRFWPPPWPVRFDGAPPKVKPSPLLGQHVDDVLGSWLGMGAKERAALREEGIV